MALNSKIRSLLSETHKGKKSVFLSGNQLDISFQTFIKAIDDSQVILENSVKPQFIGEMCQSGKFFLQVRMIRFEAKELGSDGVNLIFPISDNLIVEETRQSERFPFTDEEKVFCEILNPFDGETLLRKSVMDMSATGLSLRTTFPSQLFSPGTELPNLKVLIDGELYTEGVGTVVYGRKVLDVKGKLRTQVGIKFGKLSQQPKVPK